MADFETMPVGTAAVIVEAMGRLSFYSGVFQAQAKHFSTPESRRSPLVRAEECFRLAAKIQRLLAQTAHAPQS